MLRGSPSCLPLLRRSQEEVPMIASLHPPMHPIMFLFPYASVLLRNAQHHRGDIPMNRRQSRKPEAGAVNKGGQIGAWGKYRLSKRQNLFSVFDVGALHAMPLQ